MIGRRVWRLVAGLAIVAVLLTISATQASASLRLDDQKLFLTDERNAIESQRRFWMAPPTGRPSARLRLSEPPGAEAPASAPDTRQLGQWHRRRGAALASGASPRRLSGCPTMARSAPAGHRVA